MYIDMCIYKIVFDKERVRYLQSDHVRFTGACLSNGLPSMIDPLLDIGMTGTAYLVYRKRSLT
jgi:hypothetical protein